MVITVFDATSGQLVRELSFRIVVPRIDGPEVVRISTTVDRINNRTCPNPARFRFHLNVPGKVTLEIDGDVVEDVEFVRRAGKRVWMSTAWE